MMAENHDQKSITRVPALSQKKKVFHRNPTSVNHLVGPPAKIRMPQYVYNPTLQDERRALTSNIRCRYPSWRKKKKPQRVDSTVLQGPRRPRRQKWCKHDRRGPSPGSLQWGHRGQVFYIVGRWRFDKVEDR